MVNVFFSIIRKTFFLIKSEPAILLPALIFHVGLSFLSYFGISIENLITNSLSWAWIIGWIFPIVIIEPIIIFAAWILIKKTKISFNLAVNQYIYGIGGIFLISFITKPLDIYLFQSLKQYLEVSEDPTAWMSEIGATMMLIWFASLIFRLLIFYFKFDYITSLNNQPNIVNSLKNSTAIFLSHKWLTLGALIYWQIFFISVSFGFSLILVMLPKAIYGNFVGIVSALETVFSTIFFLMVFLKLKPVTNLNDN